MLHLLNQRSLKDENLNLLYIYRLLYIYLLYIYRFLFYIQYTRVLLLLLQKCTSANSYNIHHRS